MANFRPINAWNFERGNILEAMGSVQSGITRNTSSPVTGTADMTIPYPSGASQTWTLATSLLGMSAPSGTFRKSSTAFPFKFTANPANHAALGVINSLSFYISSARKIRYNGVDSSDTALTANTVYWLNMICDKDWNALGSGAILFRVYNTSGTLLQSLTANVANPSPTFSQFGEVQLKAQNGPATTMHIGSGVVLYDTSPSVKAPWWGLPAFEAIRVAQSVGTENDAIGVSEATNKHLNVDEDPGSGTDYNHMGEIGVTDKQTLLYGTDTYSDTILAYSVQQKRKLSAGQTISGDIRNLLVHDSVEYELNESPSSVVAVTVRGGDKMPDGDTITESNLDALRAGFRTNLTDQTYNSGQDNVSLPVSDGATYDEFTPSTGTDKFAVVDETSGAPNDSDYLTSGTSGQRQGFGMNWNPTPADIGDTIWRIRVRVRARNFSTGSGSFIRVFAIIDSVYYETSSILAGGSISSWSDMSFEIAFNGSNVNPETGLRFTPSDITSAEWGIHHVTKGTGDLQVSQMSLGSYGPGRVIQEATWLNVITGDPFTENGNVSKLGEAVSVNQSVKRGAFF